MINALTVDVEDEFSILSRNFLRRECRPSQAVVENTNRLLEVFAARTVRATFFVLGEVAEAFPRLIRDIAAAGHELGVHGYYHRQVTELTPETFRQEVADAKALIEDIAGVEVVGHRAPVFSILPSTRWALEVLAELGFRYDSSISLMTRRRDGWSGVPLDIHTIGLDSGQSIIEVPLSAISFLGLRLQCCGGGYLRRFPRVFSEWAFRHIQRHRPVIVYTHPYEIDVQPRRTIDTAGLDAVADRAFKRCYRRSHRKRDTVERKLGRLLEQFEFAPLSDVVDHVLPNSKSAAVRMPR